MQLRAAKDQAHDRVVVAQTAWDTCVADKDCATDEMFKRKAQLDYARQDYGAIVEEENEYNARLMSSIRASAEQMQHATDQMNQQMQVNQLSTAISAPPPMFVPMPPQPMLMTPRPTSPLGGY